jgi:hypothetical protein
MSLVEPAGRCPTAGEKMREGMLTGHLNRRCLVLLWLRKEKTTCRRADVRRQLVDE